MTDQVKIAMWSGPRNISTAMMRSFENRPDCAVSDEPFYGHFLVRTGINHPMANDVIADMDCDYESVAAAIVGPNPGRAPIWYQKHMTHHMLAGDRLNWTAGMVNCFLIREPTSVVASYARRREITTLSDIGVERQCEIFDYIRGLTGTLPPVLDAVDILTNPERALTALCDACGIPFDSAMLAWPAGRRETDGIWCAHWYHAVEASTGFKPYAPEEVDLGADLAEVAEAAKPYYERMAAYRLLN